MKKRFIICIDLTTKENDKIFIDFLRSKNVGWWHWISNLWLISDNKGQFTASEFRQIVSDIYKGQHNIVFELSSTKDTWSGLGPASGTRNMFTWLKENWKK